MTPDKIRNLAIECGADVSPHGQANFLDLEAYTAAVEAPLQADIQTLTDNLIKVNDSWAVTHKNTEESLYAQLRIANGDLNQSQSKLDEANTRIAQLEEALTRIYGNGDVDGNSSWCDSHEDCQDAANYSLNSSPSTWLSEHDKEVAVRERERCRLIASEHPHHYGNAISLMIGELK